MEVRVAILGASRSWPARQDIGGLRILWVLHRPLATCLFALRTNINGRFPPDSTIVATADRKLGTIREMTVHRRNVGRTTDRRDKAIGYPNHLAFHADMMDRINVVSLGLSENSARTERQNPEKNYRAPPYA